MRFVWGERRPADLPSHSKSLLAIVDFSYQHYALGDILTTQIDLAIIAIEQNLDHVDVAAVANPRLPSARNQGYVTSENYIAHYDGIVPAFTCNPMLRTLQLIRDVDTLNYLVLSRYQSGAPMWPKVKTHLRMRQDYPIGHAHINAFHARHGFLPQLCAPRGYEGWARGFHERELANRPLVIINPRQASLTRNPAALYRDAQLGCWYAFIDAAAARRPDALFVMVGGFQEWESSLLRRRNVFIPRAFGLSLAHELALMKIADMFLGSPSGFATFATFTDMPYAIVNYEHRFAPHGELSAGDRHYPFAHANQVLTWHRETTEELLALFEELCTHLKTRDDAISDDRSAELGLEAQKGSRQ